MGIPVRSIFAVGLKVVPCLIASLVTFEALAQTLPANQDGIEIPEFGRNISIENVFVTKDRHLVLDFRYDENGIAQEDFYDTQNWQRLFPKQASQIAHDNQLRTRLASAAGLVEVPMQRAFSRNGISVSTENSSTEKCAWPYSISLVIKAPGKESIRRSIATHKNPPSTKSYIRFCGSGDETLTTKYNTSDIRLFSDGKDGFFAQPAKTAFLIHFDRNGDSKFFSGRSDIVLVQSEALQSLIDEVPHSKLPEQTFIERMDELLDNTASKQKSEVQIRDTAPEGDGYEIPTYGEETRIWSVFTAPDGHIVLRFTYKDNGQLKSD